ncbi:UBP-type zinc finger domain-containing protein [Pseudarthrobacter sp. L1SW]|nr:UBP-type zinc finger domain-containing protein [Pseudarthrobacter sp. L1SW]
MTPYSGQTGPGQSRGYGNGGLVDDHPVPGINLDATPSGTGCEECLNGEGAGWWLHLRRCAQCGHIGCCDSSPSQHASAHARTAGHPVVRSFEPGEDWFYEHTTKKFFRGPRLPDPQSRPPEQPSPAPAGKVPADWRERLHR